MVQGQVFLKQEGGGAGASNFAFRDYSLQNCVMHLKKKIFFLTP